MAILIYGVRGQDDGNIWGRRERAQGNFKGDSNILFLKPGDDYVTVFTL